MHRQASIWHFLGSIPAYFGHNRAFTAPIRAQTRSYISIDLSTIGQISWRVLTFPALADPTRRRIVEMLARGPLSAGEIAGRFTVSPSAVSQHLKVLRGAKLVRSRVAAQQRIYELDTEGLAEIESWLDALGPLWQKRLEALQRERRL